MDPDAVGLGYVLNDPEPTLFVVDEETGRPLPRVDADAREIRMAPRPPDRWWTASRILRVLWQRRADRKRTARTVEYHRTFSPIRAPAGPRAAPS